MAIKKRNQKKSHKKANNNQKSNNNCKQNVRQKGDKSRDTSVGDDEDVAVIMKATNGDPAVVVAKNGSNRVTNSKSSAVDVFGDSDKRVDVNRVEKTSPADQLMTATTKCLTTYSPKGLSNLGNTCYMNSVLQIISETHLLFDVLNERSNDGYIYRAKSLMNGNEWSVDHTYDDEYDIVLGNCLPLTQSLIGFMRDMRSSHSRTISPAKLLRDIRKEWNQFDGWAQQDSHELLRCLLDSLKCKEVKRQRIAVCQEFKSGSNREDNNLDDDTKSRIKSFATYTQLTPIDTVFGGQLLSSVCCDVCQYTNLIFEPFFDLSLPLTHLTANCDNNSAVIVVNGSTSKFKGNGSTSGATNGKPEEDTSLLDKDPKKLKPKERKALRAQKKAAKRDAKQSKKLETNFIISGDKWDSSDHNVDTEEVVTKPEISSEPNDNKSEENSEANESEVKTETTDVLGEESDGAADDWHMEPLLGDFNGTISFKTEVTDEEKPITTEATEVWDFSADLNGAVDEGEEFGFGLLFDNEDDGSQWLANNLDEGWNTGVDENEWNESGWVWNEDGLHECKPVFGPQLPPDMAVDSEVASDECKAQEQEFNTDLETELLMMSISDREKIDLKQQSTTDGHPAATESDTNSVAYREIITKSLQTISDNRAENLPNFDLIRLLTNFTAVERLSGHNKYLCDLCTKTNEQKQKTFTNASKRALIALPPPVLTLHLKRFEAEGYRRSVSFKKISTFVSFPATFDLAPFVSQMYNYLQPITGQPIAQTLIYSLYGVVEHSGGLKSGHYTAYVKHRPFNPKYRQKFANFEPFVPKMDSVLKMIDKKYFNTHDNLSTSSPINGHTNGVDSVDSSQTNGTGGDDSGANGVNGTDSDDHSSVDGVDREGKWYHISDTSVSSSSLSSVLRSQAYILFYERIV